MKSLIVIFTLLCVFIVGGCSDSNPTKNAYLSLKKVEAIATFGPNITHKQYRKSVDDAQNAINTLRESSNVMDTDPVRGIIRSANLIDILEVHQRYLFAGLIWSNKLESGSLMIDINSDLYKQINADIPSALEGTMSESGNEVDGQKVIQKLWNEASKKLERMSKLIK
jgi:hypothetical protein